MTLAANHEDKTVAKRGKQFEVNPRQIMELKQQLLERAAIAPGDGAEKAETVVLTLVNAKDGQLTLVNEIT